MRQRRGKNGAARVPGGHTPGPIALPNLKPAPWARAPGLANRPLFSPERLRVCFIQSAVCAGPGGGSMPRTSSPPCGPQKRKLLATRAGQPTDGPWAAAVKVGAPGACRSPAGSCWSPGRGRRGRDGARGAGRHPPVSGLDSTHSHPRGRQAGRLPSGRSPTPAREPLAQEVGAASTLGPGR